MSGRLDQVVAMLSRVPSGAAAITSVTELQRGDVTANPTTATSSLSPTGGGMLLVLAYFSAGTVASLGGTLSASFTQVGATQTNASTSQRLQVWQATTYSGAGTITFNAGVNHNMRYSVVEVLGGSKTIVQSKFAKDESGGAAQSITMDAAITTGSYSLFWVTCSNALRSVSVVNTGGYTHVQTAPISVSFLKKTPAGNTMSVTWDAGVFGDEVGLEIS